MKELEQCMEQYHSNNKEMLKSIPKPLNKNKESTTESNFGEKNSAKASSSLNPILILKTSG